MNKQRRLGLIAKQTVFVGALLVGCESSDSTKQQLTRESNSSTQMPSWEATKQSEERMPDIQPETYMAAGRMHETRGRLTRAAAQYRMAVQLNPKNAEAHNRLGLALCQMQQFKEAEAELTQAISLAPAQAYLYNNLGFNYLIQSRWLEAEAQFRKALALNAGFGRAHVNLGMVLAQQERFDEALRHFEIVVPLEDAWFNIGLMYQSKSHQGEAARAFKTALKFNPKMVAAQQCLDKLPSDVSSSANPFESVTALASATKAEPSPRQAAEPVLPVESVAVADQPSVGGQTTPVQSEYDDIDTVESSEPTMAQPAETAEESLELADAPSFHETPVEESTALAMPDSGMDDEDSEDSEDGIDGMDSEDVEPAPKLSSFDDQEESEVQPIDSETLDVLMNTRSPESGTTADTLNSSTQPENESSPPSTGTFKLANQTEPTARPMLSSTSQPSFVPPVPDSGVGFKGLFTVDIAPPEPDPDTIEIVLSSRPPLPPGTRNAVLLATRPASDLPTPEELRTVIEALLELSRTQNTDMLKPYSMQTTQPAAETPQSQPSAARTDLSEQLSMGVEVDADEITGNWDYSAWAEYESIFSPGETSGPTNSEP